MAANSVVPGPILQNRTLIYDIMVILIACKNEEDPIKIEAARVVTTFLPLEVYGNYYRHSRAANYAVPGPILLDFEPIQDCVAVLVTFRNEEDPIKIEGTAWIPTLYIEF